MRRRKLLTKAYLDQLTLELAWRAVAYSRPKIPSATLQNNIRVRRNPSGSGHQMYLPHYWAIYIHEGRGPVTPKEKLYLVWFRNPKDDPRIRKTYGVKRPPRSLKPSEWKFWNGENAKAKRAGQPVPMIVTQFAGESRSYRAGGRFPSRFWGNEAGMRGFIPLGRRMVKDNVSKTITENIKATLTWKA